MKEHIRNLSLAFRPQTYIYTVLKIYITKRYTSSYRYHRNIIKTAK